MCVAEPTAGILTIGIQADDCGASNNLSLVAIASISVTAADAQPPVLAANQMTIDEGGTAVLSAAELAAKDPDSDEGGLPFPGRSAEPRIGRRCVSTCRRRWSRCHKKKN